MRATFRARLRILLGVIGLFALLLIVRLYFVQIVNGSEYALRADRQYLSQSSALFDRGSIYFTRADGTLISAATLGSGFVLTINPSKITDAEATYEAIASITPIDHAIFIAQATKPHDVYEEVAHHLPESAGTAISALKLPGVSPLRERWREYPGGPLAAQSIGFVAYSSDSSDTLAGRYGLERYYNDTLERDSGSLYQNFFAQLFANLGNALVDARASRQGDIVTTIEPEVQAHMEADLKAVEAKYSSQATGGIIMDPATGEIIALGVTPSFDLSDFQNGNPEYFGNPLVSSVYEFGSIMKPLTMASGIDAGVITPSTTYNDTGCITVNGSRICNYDLKARGVIPMQQVLSQSLNVGASYIATQLGPDRFRQYFNALKFGEETGIDLPSEIHGITNNLTSPRQLEYDNMSFGQGIAETPVEMIRALGSLANHGAMVTPHLVRSIRLDSGIVKTLDWGAPQQVFKPASTQAVTQMLTEVVDTALAHGDDKIPEMSVSAKTGTAQMAQPGGGYYANEYFHSFFGYFPSYSPRFVILLYTVKPQGVQYASETLTTTFEDLVHFLINYYNIPPDRAHESNS
jgi:cell division protein FtsI/penicillin-binding protein 2